MFGTKKRGARPGANGDEDSDIDFEKTDKPVIDYNLRVEIANTMVLVNKTPESIQICTQCDNAGYNPSGDHRTFPHAGPTKLANGVTFYDSHSHCGYTWDHPYHSYYVRRKGYVTHVRASHQSESKSVKKPKAVSASFEAIPEKVLQELGVNAESLIAEITKGRHMCHVESGGHIPTAEEALFLERVFATACSSGEEFPYAKNASKVETQQCDDAMHVCGLLGKDGRAMKVTRETLHTTWAAKAVAPARWVAEKAAEWYENLSAAEKYAMRSADVRKAKLHVFLKSLTYEHNGKSASGYRIFQAFNFALIALGASYHRVNNVGYVFKALSTYSAALTNIAKAKEILEEFEKLKAGK